MCLAIPGKIIEIKGDSATVDYDGVLKKIDISMIDADVGDFVVANAGFAIKKVDKKEAKEAIRLFQEISGQD